MYGAQCMEVQERGESSAMANGKIVSLTKEDVGSLSQYQRILDLRPVGFRALGYNTSVGVIQ